MCAVSDLKASYNSWLYNYDTLSVPSSTGLKLQVPRLTQCLSLCQRGVLPGCLSVMYDESVTKNCRLLAINRYRSGMSVSSNANYWEIYNHGNGCQPQHSLCLSSKT